MYLTPKWVPVKPAQANTAGRVHAKAGYVPCIKLRYSQGELGICGLDPSKNFWSGVLLKECFHKS